MNSENKEVFDKCNSDSDDLRIYGAIVNDFRRMIIIASAKAMKEDGLTNSEIAKRLGLPNESSVRSLLNTNEEAKSIHEAAADINEDQEYKDA